MNDYIEKIQSFEKKIKDNELELAKLSEREKNLKEEKVKIQEELKTLNISEDDLEGEIDVLETKIKKEIENIEKELN